MYCISKLKKSEMDTSKETSDSNAATAGLVPLLQTDLTRPRLSLSTDLDLNSPPTYYKPQTYELCHPIKAASTTSVAPLLLYNQLATQIQHLPSDKVFDSNRKLCRICLECEQIDESDIEASHKAGEELPSLNSQIPDTLKPYQPTPVPTVAAPQKLSFREAIKAVKQNTIKNPLIHPCRCQGTMAYIHVECLNRWRKESPRPESYYRCDTCHYDYNLYRPYWASVISNRNLHRLITAFLVILLVFMIAYMVKILDVYGLKHIPRPYDPNWVEFHGRTVLWIDLFYIVIALIITATIGLVYIAVSEYRGGSMRPLSFGNCCMSFNIGPPTCSDDGGSGILLFVMALCFVLFLILYGLYGAAIGIFLAVGTWVDWVCNEIVERVIEV